MRLRRRPRLEELFVLNAIVALLWAVAWMFRRNALLLEYFYFDPLLALTHLVTLGFLSSLMMGVLYRLSPMLLSVEPRSRKLGAWQLALFLIGSWGMIAHFFIGELVGMSWSAALVWAAGAVQLSNFGRLFRGGGRAPWARRFVAASLVFFFLAATLGLLVAVAKAYDLRFSVLASQPLANVFAHAHLAGVGWVTLMVFGFQLKLVPSTGGGTRSLPYRFVALVVGTLGVAAALLLEWSPLPFALALGVAVGWQSYGPGRALVKGRAREWELVPLVLLTAAAGLGIALASGWPEPTDPARGRLQLAYALLAVLGFMVSTVVVVAFKLFPMFVWKDRFQSEFGKRPVPGMKELHSQRLQWAANTAVPLGAFGTALAVAVASDELVRWSTGVLFAGVVCFVWNLLRVVRWSLLDIQYRPSRAERRKFEEMFPARQS